MIISGVAVRHTLFPLQISRFETDACSLDIRHMLSYEYLRISAQIGSLLAKAEPCAL